MITFIVIGKNEGWRLTKCLTSIHMVIQDDKIADYEIIFVDSKSTDDSIERALSYNDVQVFEITGECNAAIARNMGAQEAKGDILFFIDGDMEILSGFLTNVIDNSGGLIYPFLSGIYEDYIYDEDWKFIENKRRYKLTEGMSDQYEVTTGGLFLIEKKLWESVCGMDTRMVRSQDLDLGLTLSNKGMPLMRKPILLANHHTIYYLSSSSMKQYLASVKYSAILSRKHIFNKNYWPLFIRTQYTVFALIISLFFAFLVSYLFLVLYLVICLFKSYKIYKKSNQTYIDAFALLLYRDIQFLLTFMFVFPKEKKLEYKKNEMMK